MEEMNLMNDKLYVTAIFEAKPDRVEDLIAVLRDLAEPSRAESGCIEYCFYQDCETPTTIFAIETWESPATLAAHAASPHFQAAAAKLGNMLTKPLAIHKTRKII